MHNFIQLLLNTFCLRSSTDSISLLHTVYLPPSLPLSLSPRVCLSSLSAFSPPAGCPPGFHCNAISGHKRHQGESGSPTRIGHQLQLFPPPYPSPLRCILQFYGANLCGIRHLHKTNFAKTRGNCSAYITGRRPPPRRRRRRSPEPGQTRLQITPDLFALGSSSPPPPTWSGSLRKWISVGSHEPTKCLAFIKPDKLSVQEGGGELCHAGVNKYEAMKL